MNTSLSVVMPALNEERHLRAAVRDARARIASVFEDWEILIFNDGSTDQTGAIADELAAAEDRVLAFHHQSPKNLGGVYRAGIRQASKELIIMLPGDNENCGASLSEILQQAGQADMVIPYVVNPQVRPWRRRLISKTFVWLVQLFSGCPVRYFNGTVLHRTDLLKQIEFKNDGFGYQAEIIIGLIRQGRSYKEIGVELTPKQETKTKAFRPSNVVKVVKFITGLFSSRFTVSPVADPSLR